ncbi:hypothetical protein Hanom_Chr01g00024441 [Helianthus anomalus]
MWNPNYLTWRQPYMQPRVCMIQVSVQYLPYKTATCNFELNYTQNASLDQRPPPPPPSLCKDKNNQTIGNV